MKVSYQICALLGYYAASCGNCLLTHCHETSVNNYHTMSRNIPEERRSHQHRGGSLKSSDLSASRSVALLTVPLEV
jgi:hypothetical protein